MTSTQLAIVILNYNGLEDTEKCLSSLSKQTAKNFISIVVDNASHESPHKLEVLYPEIVLIRRESNGGWTGGNNAGIDYALKQGCELVILLNNDTVVAPQFVERMLQAAEYAPSFGIIGPLIHAMDRPDIKLTEGCLFNPSGYNGFFENQVIPVWVTTPPTVMETEIVNGCCMMIRREVFEQVGSLDERFFLVHEESDFCLRAAEKNWKCGVLSEPLVWHRHAATFQRTGGNWKLYYDLRNLWLLLKKHPHASPDRRNRLASLFQYLKYSHYAFSKAVEDNNQVDQEIIVSAIADALTSCYGAKPEKSRHRIMKPCVYLLLRILSFSQGIKLRK